MRKRPPCVSRFEQRTGLDLLVESVYCARSFIMAFFPPAIEKHTGAFANMPHNLAMLPPVVIKEAVKVAKHTETDGEERLLTPGGSCAKLGWFGALLIASWAETGPAGWISTRFEAPSDPGAAPPAVKVVEASASGAKKLKMAHILDQGDESEFTLADAGHITVWFHNFVAITHGQPDEEETPQATVGVEREGGRSTGQTSPFSRLTRGKAPELGRMALGWRKRFPAHPIFRHGFTVGGSSVWRA